MKRLITPDPNIPCAPGWCLQYVRQAFGLEARYASATEAWQMSESKHLDRNFPVGKWVPVWYGLDTTPLGHVVLLAPDRSVYSTSDLGNVPHHHPDLADLEAYYAYYGMNLTYRGWTEDVAGYPVLEPNPTLALQGTIQKEGFLMAVSADKQEEAVDRILRYLDAPSGAIPNKVWEQTVVHGGTHSVRTELVQTRKQVIALTAAVTALAKNPNLTADQITEAVKAGLAEAVVDVDVNVIAKEIEPRG